MEYDSGIPMSVTEGHSSALTPSLREGSFANFDALWQMNLGSGEIMGSGSYPVRPGEPDCSYYIRTGLCRFGATCRFNHPPNRELAIATARMKGEFPERIGQPECQYYLKTGTCKFGATCKFHHPRDKAGIAGRVALNILGYPLRPSETECAYYLRTGQCKFGNTCKFHHPQPTNMMVSLRGSPIYPTVQSPTPGQQSYPGGSTNWSRASFIPSPRWQGPSSYASLILPQGVLSVPGWNTFNDQLGSVSSSESPQQTRENVFPERPGQPECQFYMKTGDCKFGAVCRFHHPRERVIPAPDCVLSPIGLPLRPGEPLCIFYSRYGICKFGPSCKFDHPMGIFAYNLSAASTPNAPVQHLFGTSSGTTALSLSSEGLVEAGSAKPRRLSITETREMSSDDENIEAEG
ncbi:zinc finger CCCH domain-containing protein ZFN-like isoform X2 [Cucurbita pepo subsp. pepo]|uniref:zinc finger CCCH domain-containing protein ZFN-like isoform X2 n=1 Tax=Cucurbita pepo subsp. pepo TaxID=3664 RepID=UPI000C9D2CD8|nr:zinc finger CCCH domain-containing protein ZFN-like isoform X2 [Cucurbita pepo subsp. pepo]